MNETSATTQPEPTVCSAGELDAEDKRKLCAEINQIEHHRFTLTMAAVTVFGVVTAWLIPKNPPQSTETVGRFTCAGSIFLQTLLFAIFIVNHKFRVVMRLIAGYLVTRKASQWERDWNKIRGNGDFGYSEWQSALFLILVVLAALWPVALGLLYDLRFEPQLGIAGAAAAGVAYSFVIGVLGWTGWERRDKRIADQWQRVLEAAQLEEALSATRSSTSWPSPAPSLAGMDGGVDKVAGDTIHV